MEEFKITKAIMVVRQPLTPFARTAIQETLGKMRIEVKSGKPNTLLLFLRTPRHSSSNVVPKRSKSTMRPHKDPFLSFVTIGFSRFRDNILVAVCCRVLTLTRQHFGFTVDQGFTMLTVCSILGISRSHTVFSTGRVTKQTTAVPENPATLSNSNIVPKRSKSTM